MLPEHQDRLIQASAIGCLNSNTFEGTIFISGSRKYFAIMQQQAIGLYSCICTLAEIAQGRWDLYSVTKLKRLVQKAWFAFILKVEVPYFCLNRADGAYHLEIQRNQHRLREEAFVIKHQLMFLQQKKVAAILRSGPTQKRHSCLIRTLIQTKIAKWSALNSLYICSVIVNLVQLPGFKHVNVSTLERKFYIWGTGKTRKWGAH